MGQVLLCRALPIRLGPQLTIMFPRTARVEAQTTVDKGCGTMAQAIASPVLTMNLDTTDRPSNRCPPPTEAMVSHPVTMDHVHNPMHGRLTAGWFITLRRTSSTFGEVWLPPTQQ